MKKNTGLLVVISGPSGVGKNTIIEELMQKNPDAYVYSVSATTRPPRGEEKHGVNYFFLNKEEFEKKIKNNDFIEYAQYQNNYYGTPKFFIEENLKFFKTILLDIDVQGALKVMRTKYPLFFIFIAPASLEILRERLKKRGTESETRIQSRIEAAKLEMMQSGKFDAVVINKEVETTVAEVEILIMQKLASL